MAIDPNTPVTAIEGIGPATARKLNDEGVYNVFDLLRATVSEVHSVVDGIASEAEVARWQMMARLLQIDPMTPQWAEGLVRGGIESIQELAFKAVADIGAVLTTARDEGQIPDVPDAEQIVEMLRDAAVIHHTGALMLTVADRSSNPVSNAVADVGGISETTDARGRVRLIRIPLGFEHTLRIQHDDYGLLLLHDVPVSADPAAISTNRVMLPNAGDPDDAAAATLSEYEGHEIPAIATMPAREVILAATELRDQDLLFVRQFYSSADDVQLASMLRDRINGEIVVYQYRVPISSFDRKPVIGELYVFRDGAFLERRADVNSINRHRVGRRMQKAFSDRPEPSTPDELLQDKMDRFQFYVDQGACSGIRSSRR